MSMFKPLEVHKYQTIGTTVTPDVEYWRYLETPTIVKEFGAIDYIDFNPIEPYYFAVTCSVRVQIYNPITKLLVKNLSRFQDVAYGGTFRKDGRLLVAGDVQGFVRLFDTSSKNILRLFKGHKSAVHRVNFTNDLLNIVSFSDDKTVKLWDITAEQMVHNFSDHEDYIRAGAVNPVSANMIVSGAYDGKINVYDSRMNEVCYSLYQGNPLESLLFLPTGGILLSAGGNEIYVWDLLSRHRPLAKLIEHHKTVTCLRLASEGKRILSSSLDRHIKIYDVATFRAVHTLNFPNSVLSLGLAPNDQSLVVGMVDGLISMQNMDLDRRNQKRKSQKELHKRVLSVKVDHTIMHVDHPKLAKFNRCLRKYKYVKCLDIVLTSFIMKKRPEITVTVMQELIHRKGLHRALAGREHNDIKKVIDFIRRYIGEFRFMRVLINVTHVLFDVCKHQNSLLTGDLGVKFAQLSNVLKRERNTTLELLTVQGGLELMIDCVSADNCTKKYFIKNTHATPTQSVEAKEAAIFVV